MRNDLEKLMYVIVGLLAVVVVVGVVLSVAFRGSNVGYYNGYYGMMGGVGFGWMIIMPILAVLSLVLLFVFLYYLVTAVSHGGSSATVNSGNSPEEVAKMRFARGEITKEQYEEILKSIRG